MRINDLFSFRFRAHDLAACWQKCQSFNQSVIQPDSIDLSAFAKHLPINP